MTPKLTSPPRTSLELQILISMPAITISICMSKWVSNVAHPKPNPSLPTCSALCLFSGFPVAQVKILQVSWIPLSHLTFNSSANPLGSTLKMKNLTTSAHLHCHHVRLSHHHFLPGLVQ